MSSWLIEKAISSQPRSPQYYPLNLQIWDQVDMQVRRTLRQPRFPELWALIRRNWIIVEHQMEEENDE